MCKLCGLIFGLTLPVKHDLYADKPWAFSPLLSTVFRCQADRGAENAYKDCTSAKACFENDAWPAFPTPENDTEPHYAVDDISPLFYRKNEQGEKELEKDIESDVGAVERLNGREHEHAERARATWLGNQQRRAKLQVTPDDVLTVDFCNGYVWSAEGSGCVLTCRLTLTRLYRAHPAWRTDASQSAPGASLCRRAQL